MSAGGHDPARQVKLDVSLVQPLVDALAARGVDIVALARERGLALSTLMTPGLRITHADWIARITRGIQLTSEPMFHVRAARSVRETGVNFGQYVASAQATVGEAYGGVAPYFRLLHPQLVVKLVEEDEFVHCQVGFTAGLPFPGVLAEYLIARCIALGKFVLGRLYRAPFEVHFRHIAHVDAAEMRVELGCPVRFDAKRNSVVFPRQHLDSELVGFSRGLGRVPGR